jgi:DNA-binding NarL/FixJ family response regulator
MILLDISMPNLRGIEAIREIKQSTLKQNIDPHDAMGMRILTSHLRRRKRISKETDTELSTAIDTIRRGKIYISPLLSGDLTDDWAQTYRGKSKLPYEPDNLTTREREVLKMIAEGKSSKEIADLLFISVRTVERHRANLMDKLSLKKTADLVKYAIQKGYV